MYLNGSASGSGPWASAREISVSSSDTRYAFGGGPPQKDSAIGFIREVLTAILMDIFAREGGFETGESAIGDAILGPDHQDINFSIQQKINDARSYGPAMPIRCWRLLAGFSPHRFFADRAFTGPLNKTHAETVSCPA
jgi:hypothetical protein